MKRILFQCTALLMIAAMFGCATIVSKSSYPLYIRSTPLGAKVIITDKKDRTIYKGVTPAKLMLKSGAGYFSKAQYQVTISATGYEDRVFPVYFKLNGWYFGNLLIGGLIGMLIVDPLTGAMWKIEDPIFDETLVRSNTPVVNAPTTPALNVVDINSLSADLRSHLVKLQ